jgi:hypothetical protein
VCVATQVGLAQFLDFCLSVSEANGNALPVLVGHNVRFDCSVLLTGLWQSGLCLPPSWGTLCTYGVAKQMLQTFPEIMEMENLKLGTLAKAFGCAPIRFVWCCATSSLHSLRLGLEHATSFLFDGSRSLPIPGFLRLFRSDVSDRLSCIRCFSVRSICQGVFCYIYVPSPSKKYICGSRKWKTCSQRSQLNSQ